MNAAMRLACLGKSSALGANHRKAVSRLPLKNGKIEVEEWKNRSFAQASGQGAL
jgi:hypothetical protein